MGIGSALLSPSGRLGPAMFLKCSLILIAVGFVLAVLPALSPAFIALGFLSLVLIYPWVVIWVKRLHDAGKSGWLFLVVLILWVIVGVIASFAVNAMFAPAQTSANATDLSAVWAATAAQAQATAIPNGVVSAVISFVFVFLGNMMLKSDPGPNPYGPPPTD